MDDYHLIKCILEVDNDQNCVNLNLLSLVFSSLSRYKLKFSPDKVDTMIVQAICKCFIFNVFKVKCVISPSVAKWDIIYVFTPVCSSVG